MHTASVTVGDLVRAWSRVAAIHGAVWDARRARVPEGDLRRMEARLDEAHEAYAAIADRAGVATLRAFHDWANERAW